MRDRNELDRDILHAALNRGPDCPPAEELARVAADSQLAAHAESCTWCQTEIKLLQTFETADVSDQEAEDVRQVMERLEARSSEIFPVEADAPPPLPWWKSPVVWAVAAVLVLVAAGIQWRRSTAPGPRPATDSASLHLAPLTVVSPVGDVHQPPQDVEWQKVEGAKRYEVQLLGADQREIWRVGTRGLRVVLVPEIQKLIEPKKTILCQVTAFDEAEAKVAVSPLVRFRLVP